MTILTWTDDRVEQLKRLWEAGFSASQVAAELGDVTRNAVIGKVHRLGLSGRVRKAGRGPARPPQPKPRAAGGYVRPKQYKDYPPSIGNTALANAYEPEPEPEPEISTYDNIIPINQRVTLMGLNEHTCRWPIGDVQKPDFHFCGARPSDGAPYCAHHCRVAYQPASDRRRGRRGEAR